jgi:hypothetical protein
MGPKSTYKSQTKEKRGLAFDNLPLSMCLKYNIFCKAWFGNRKLFSFWKGNIDPHLVRLKSIERTAISRR